MSPLAPASFPLMPAVRGIEIATTAAGIKYKNRADLLLMTVAEGSSIAGVFTKSLTASAPVDLCRANLKYERVRAIVVNSGNSNAFTGKAGFAASQRVIQSTAKILDCSDKEVFVASTGVIGELLPTDGILASLPRLLTEQKADAWEEAARAIMTTDTFPKGATRRCRIGDVTVTLNGIAKGSGMIAPDMATMLAFVATDATIPSAILQELLCEGTSLSFNAITVDSDTSTSDTVLLVASNQASHQAPQDAQDPLLADFKTAIFDLLKDLAQQIVRDGEGASKFVSITVKGATDNKAAKTIALAVANSPLVKTAIAGEDPNWGRIVMAVGKAGERADRDRLNIAIGGITIADQGAAVEGYDESPVSAYMKGQEIDILIDVGVRDEKVGGQAMVWTCDLTQRYISINSDYRS